MTVRHSDFFRDILAQALAEQLAGGRIVFQTQEDREVATLNLSAPAATAPIDGTTLFLGVEPDTLALGGIIAKARFYDADGREALACSVTKKGGGGDIELNEVQVEAGAGVSVDLLSYEAPE